MTHAAGGERPLRVAQVSFHRDRVVRDAEAQLRAWPTLHGVASGVARAGVEVTVVQPARSGQTLRRDAVTYEFVPDAALPGRLGRVVPPRRLIERVRASAPQVIHVQGFAYPFGVYHLARALPGVPLLVQDHAGGTPAGLRRLVWRRAFGSLRGATFTSRAQAAPLLEAGVLRRDLPIWEVLEGSTGFTPGDREAARAATGLSGDPCLLWTGHLNANKDPLTVLEAFRLAAARLPDARLWCCFGNAPLLAEVDRAMARSDVLRERVTLLGARTHPAMEPLFRAADLFVQLSHHEACGYSVIEAMACGTPPLVSDIAPFRAIVGSAGSLTPVEDAPALAAAMVAWGAGDRRAQRLAARERFERALSFDVIGRKLRAVYEYMESS